MYPRIIEKELAEIISDTPAVALLGPRQVGKTTLVKQMATQFPFPTIYLDLESDTDLNRLRDAELYLGEREDSSDRNQYTNSPVLSRGNTLAQEDLGNPPLLVVTPSAEDYNMRENVVVCSIGTLGGHLERLVR